MLIRKCIDCGVDIQDRHGNAKKCLKCSLPQYNVKRSDLTGENFCDICEKDISYRRKTAKWCEHCAVINRREYMRLIMTKRKPFKEQLSKDDVDCLKNQHMVGKGTFVIAPFKEEDWEREWMIIQKLRKVFDLK